MALEFDLTMSAIAADNSYQEITDETVYGGANPARSARGNYLLVYKMDKDGQIVSDVTPDQVDDFLTILTWQFTTALDGWNQFILLSVPIWDVATNYEKESVAGANDEDIVYYDTNKEFYRCITNNVGSAPTAGGDANWELISDFSEIVDNTGDADPMDTYYHDDLVTSRHEDEFVDALEANIDSTFQTGALQYKEVELYEKLGILLDGALSLNYADRMGEAERVSRYVENTYLS